MLRYIQQIIKINQSFVNFLSERWQNQLNKIVSLLAKEPRISLTVHATESREF